MMKKIKLVFSTLFLVNVTTSVYALNSMHIAGGYYSTSGSASIKKPLLALNQTGDEWTYIPTLPKDFIQSGFIYGTSCFENLCAAAGEYINKSGEEVSRRKPLLLISQDNGVNWSSMYKLPYNYADSGVLNSVSCSDNNCVAGGTYQSSTAWRQTLLMSSQDKGLNWTYTYLPYISSSQAEIKSVYCSKNTCIASGIVIPDATQEKFAIILWSENGGVNWYRIPWVPADYKSGYFEASTCTAAICIAGGNYQTKNSKSYPLLLLYDNNSSNSYYPFVNSSLPVDYLGAGTIYNVSCNEKTSVCVAGGLYGDKQGKYKPFIASSQDKGMNWSSKSIVPDDFYNYGRINDSSCSDSICAAVGAYFFSSTEGKPLLVFSNDKGLNWNFVNTFPTDLKSGRLRSVKCDSATCTVAGAYISTDTGNPVKPLMMITADNGAHWSYPSSILTSLPKDFKNGEFYGVKTNNDLK